MVVAPVCYRCGRSNHIPAECIHRDSGCHNCAKKGHISPVCRSSPAKPPVQPSRNNRYRKQPPRSAKWVEEGTQDSEESQEELPIHALTDNTRPLHADVLLNGHLGLLSRESAESSESGESSGSAES